jgi:hypothetical protein
MAIAVLFAVGSPVESALAQEKPNVPEQDKVALSAEGVKGLVLMMDKDKEWRIGRKRAGPIAISGQSPIRRSASRNAGDIQVVPCQLGERVSGSKPCSRMQVKY